MAAIRQVFDSVTGDEIADVGAHQAEMRELVAQGIDPNMRAVPATASFSSGQRDRSGTSDSFREPAMSMESKPHRSLASYAAPLPQWDCRNISKEEALERLVGKPVALSMLKDGGQFHQQIEQVAEGIRIKKTDKTFPNLAAFVAFYSTPSQTVLPTPLVDAFRGRSVSDARSRVGSGATSLRQVEQVIVGFRCV
eukprot:gene15862-6966_t